MFEKKHHVYLEHLGRQRWGHTARDHKQINHQQKNEKQESLIKNIFQSKDQFWHLKGEVKSKESSFLPCDSTDVAHVSKEE